MRITRTNNQMNPYRRIATKSSSRIKCLDSTSSVWNEISSRYDITNATFDELSSISKRLYETKQISLLEHGILTFNPTKSAQWANINSTFSNPKYYLTNSDGSGRRDWIAELEARLEQSQRVSNSKSKENLSRVLDVLRRLTRK